MAAMAAVRVSRLLRVVGALESISDIWILRWRSCDGRDHPPSPRL